MQLKKLTITCLAVLALVAATVSGCNKVGQFSVSGGGGSATAFGGLVSMNMTPDGHYVLYWNNVAGVADINTVTYEIYLDKWTSIPADVTTDTASLDSNDQGTVLPAQFTQLADGEAPVGKGTLLDSVKGVRSFTLNETIQAGTIYAFQVRALLSDGTQDKNQKVLIYTPSTENITFAGTTGLSVNASGAALLNWSAPILADGVDPTQVSYDIYMATSSESLSTVTAGTTAVSSSSLRLAGGPQIGSLVTMPASRLPTKVGAPIATSQVGLAYQLSQTLATGTVYLFQVQAKDPGGELGANNRVVIYQPTQLTFAGLQTSGAQISDDTSKINLSWTAATGAVGPVTYVVYGDANFTQVLGTTTTTSYSFQNPVRGKSYTFAVRAKDSNGTDKNTQFVNLTLPSLTFAGLLQSGVALAPDGSSLTLTWTAATNNQGPITYIVYQDKAFTQVLGQTTTLSYSLANPTPGASYILGVQANDATGSDGNTHFIVVSVPDHRNHTPPIFAGVASVSTMSDSKVLLKWNASTTTDLYQYNIYLASNLSQPIASTTATNYVVGSLSAGLTYTYVVRAVNTSGAEDTNVVQKSATTLSFPVPSFGGVATIAPLSGVAGLTQLSLGWSPAGGNVTGYQIFMAQSSGGEAYGAPIANVTGINTSNSTVGPYLSGQYTSSATVTGLTSGQAYYFVVRAFYLDGSNNVLSEVNQLEKSGSTNTLQAPTFAGATSAAQGSGLLALTTATVFWGQPQTNGVWDGFLVTYEAGTCAQPFSGSPTTAIVSGTSLTSSTVSGLSANTTYRFKVNSRYSTSNLLDGNTACVTATTTATPPTFSGVATLVDAAGIAGFNSLNVTWAPATGSFTYYLVEWSTTSGFVSSNPQSQITTIGTTSTTLTGLPTNTAVYVRVSAVFSGVTPNLVAGLNNVLSATTTPPAPTGEGISAVAIASATSLALTWNAPTNAGAVYSGYKLWRSCSATASADIVTAVNGAPYRSPTSGTLSYTDSGLTSGTPCCYQLRAYYSDGTNSLASVSNAPAQCATPSSVAPAFAGVQGVVTPSSASGFSTLTVNWTAIASSDQLNFSYYEIAWATTPNGQVWGSGSNLQVTTYQSATATITGLTDNTTYYVRVRAVNASGAIVANGANAVVAATTTPVAASGDALNTAAALSQTSVTLNYTPPTGGLYNNVFLFLYQGSSSQAASYHSGLGTVAAASISRTTATGAATLASPPTAGALVQVPLAQVTSGQANTFTVAGLSSNQQVCIVALAVYWVDGQPTRYLESTTATTKCTTPSATAPSFSGVTSVVGFSDNRDFTQIVVGWGSIAGACTGVNVSISTAQASPDFTTGTFSAYKNLSCSGTSVTVNGLSAYTTYYVQVQAVNVVGGTTYASGQSIELSKVTVPPAPAGDAITSAVFTSVVKAPDAAALTWTLPTAGYWNQISIWKGTGSGQSAAASDATARAATQLDHSGPTSAPYQIVNKGSPASTTFTTYTDQAVQDGKYTCYLVKAVYSDGTYYQASASTSVQCGVTAYSTPSFAGIAGASIVGTWPDGTAKIKLTFNGSPAGSIEEFWVYYSGPTGNVDGDAPPWQIVDNTANNVYNDNNAGSPGYIYVGGQGRTFSDRGYYRVRYKYYGGSDSDANFFSAGVVIPPSQSNYVYVPTTVSKLAYDYYIGTYEASLASGALQAGDRVTANEATTVDANINLATCNTAFHSGRVPLDASCGTHASTATVTSVKGATPLAANWHQAWMACRNSSLPGSVGISGATSSPGQVMVRLATEEEWRRASRWPSNNYANMWSTYTGSCNTGGGALQATGAASSCTSLVGAYDMAGNSREWVDARMSMYDITASTEDRFGYGPQIGRLLRNGIDNLTRRYANITPGVNNLALLLGSDAATSGYRYQKQYEPETESWQDPTASTSAAAPYRSFRCVAFPNSRGVPDLASMALPNEPQYTSSDLPGGASASLAQLAHWKIPDNLYVKDTKPETVVTVASSHFPTTNFLSVWNFNDSVSSSTVVDVASGVNLTASATGFSGRSFDGGTYNNAASANGNNGYISANTVFNQTHLFTFGGWIYESNWNTTVVHGTMFSNRRSQDGTGWEVLTANNGSDPTLCVAVNAGQVCYQNTTFDMRTLSSGWHHFVFRIGTTDFSTYVDGAPLGTLTIPTVIANSASYFVIGNNQSITGGALGNQPFAGVFGVAFFQPFYSFDAQQITGINEIGLNYLQTPVLPFGQTTITWAPWTELVCTPTCGSPSDTTLNYSIYRYVEPTQVDFRTRTPWAIQAGPYATLPTLTGANATALPMDPMATDGSGNNLCNTVTTSCRLVAQVAGGACNSATPSGCIFMDNDGLGDGYVQGAIYNYVMVVSDASNNFRTPLVQRYRSPYLVGEPSLDATASFRTEQRWRRASAFLVDEPYQQASYWQAAPQIMVAVPMDVSGLDHDFFIQKYEASVYSGAPVNGTPSASSAWPLQADGSGSWLPNAGGCNEKALRLGSLDPVFCGDGSQNNGTNLILQSKQAGTSLNLTDQGAFEKGCRNSSIIDGNGNIYRQRLPTDAEWVKAADWGDVNQSGVVSQSVSIPNLGVAVAGLENVNGYYGLCNTVSYGANISDSGASLHCVSRYGAADMVGNYWEWTTGQFYNGIGNDNGVDGLGLGLVLSNSGGISSQNKIDLLRGLPTAGSGSTIFDEGDTYASNLSGLASSFHGGSFGDGVAAGRFAFDIVNPPSFAVSSVGGRCVH